MRVPLDREDTPTSQPNQSRKTRSRNSELDAAIGARIRAARVTVRMSQTALAAALGVSFQQVQKYETGKDRITASTLQGIAAVLGVHPGSFFDGGPVLLRAIPDLRADHRIAERIQRIRDPVVVKRLMALVDMLAGTEGDAGDKGVVQVERPATSDEAR